MNTAAPTVPRIKETGTSKGIIMTREMMSQSVMAPIPITQTQGRLLLRSSPLYMETILGTINPRKGRFPITAATTPTATVIRPLASRSSLL
ncbi:hypothetical protein D3C80_1708740 [compost metagenome]